MKIRTGLMVIVVALVLSGCVPTTKWVKPDTPQEQQDKEWAECAYDVEKAFAGVNPRAIQGFGLQYERGKLFRQCIELKGFRKEEVR